MCQGLSSFSVFLHYFVLTKLATSSIKVDCIAYVNAIVQTCVQHGHQVLMQNIYLIIHCEYFDSDHQQHSSMSGERGTWENPRTRNKIAMISFEKYQTMSFLCTKQNQ